MMLPETRRALRDMKEPAPPECDRELDRLRTAVDQVRALHSRDDSNPFGPWCGTCMAAWPCETRRALGAPESNQEPPTASRVQ